MQVGRGVLAPRERPYVSLAARPGFEGTTTSCYLVSVPLLVALWIAVLHALAALAPGAELPRVASVWPSLSGDGATARLASATAAPTAEQWVPRSGDEGLRAPAPQPLRVVGRRTSDQRPDALRPFHALDTSAAWRRVLPDTGWRRAVTDASHAPAARGGHLPYFPTAPPLQR